MADLTQKEYWSGKVGDEWANRASRIDAMLAPMTEAALDLAAFRAGDRVIDIGCGAGATSFRIAGYGADVTGVDISPPLLEVARKRAQAAGAKVAFLEADAGEARFEQKFDAAFSRFGVMFFSAPSEAFANIRAVLQPGGRAIFIVWRALSENPWATTPIEAVAPMLKAPLTPPDPSAPGPFALADRAKIERVLGEAGWNSIEVSPWDGDIAIGGGGSLDESAEFLLKIGPCARAIVDQGLDPAAARQRLIDRLGPLAGEGDVKLRAACWLIKAIA